MGRDKAAVLWRGQPLWRQAVAALSPQVDQLALNPRPAASWPDAAPALTRVHDAKPDQGPLGGVLAGLHWAASLDPRPAWLITLPVDQPQIPGDLVAGLTAMATMTGKPAAYALEDGPEGLQAHALLACWALTSAVREAVQAALAADGAVHSAHEILGSAVVRWPERERAWRNLNRPEDLEK